MFIIRLNNGVKLGLFVSNNREFSRINISANAPNWLKEKIHSSPLPGGISIGERANAHGLFHAVRYSFPEYDPIVTSGQHLLDDYQEYEPPHGVIF